MFFFPLSLSVLFFLSILLLFESASLLSLLSLFDLLLPFLLSAGLLLLPKAFLFLPLTDSILDALHPLDISHEHLLALESEKSLVVVLTVVILHFTELKDLGTHKVTISVDLVESLLDHFHVLLELLLFLLDLIDLVL